VSNKKKHIKTNDADAFKMYLDNKMPPSEAHHFERQLLNDSFEQEALEGFASIDTNSLNKDLQSIQARLGTPSTPFWKRRAVYIAASLAITIGTISTLWLIAPNQPTTISENRDLQPLAKQAPPTVKHDQTPPSYLIIEPADERNAPQKEELATMPQAASKPIEIKKEAPLKRKAKQIETIDELTIADAESTEVESRKIMGNKGELEQKAYAIDYGTIEGTKMLGYASSTDSDFKIIKGRVMDQNRKPLPGANIQIKGTQLGTVADLDGHYEMTIPAQDSSKPLTANFIGFLAQEASKSSEDSINFILEEDMITLSEVITTETSDEENRRMTEFINAEPDGGMEKYMLDIEKSLRYPKNGSGKKELVVLLLTIDQRGDISKIDVKRSPGENYSIEAIRAVQRGADWIPASNKGFPADDTVKLKIRFNPEK
jgi:hypothetical protein